jgi:Ca2+-transporting ATPase
LLTVLLQLLVIYAPPLQAVFKTTALTPTELIVCLVLPWLVLVAIEAEKFLIRRGWLYRSEPRST